MAAKGNFTVTNLTKTNPPMSRLVFSQIKDAALGKNYSLSLVFMGPAKMKKLNNATRGKNYATDILSFTLEKNAGEIFICPTASRTKSKEFDRTYANYLSFLFIHGLMHLKGFDHGVTMERHENALRKKFNI